MTQYSLAGRTLAVAISFALSGAGALAGEPTQAKQFQLGGSSIGVRGEAEAPPLGLRREGGVTSPTDEHGRRRYIVSLAEAPLATYRGGVAGLAPTHPASRGERRLDADSSASQNYLQWLETRQAQHLTRMEQVLSRSIRVDHRYRHANNGFALWLTDAEALRVAKLRDVRQVELDYADRVATDAGPERINAPALWEGMISGIEQTRGEGLVIGVVDTGINFGHPSFAATDAQGFTHTNPLGSGTFLGWCDPAHPQHDPAFACNDKLIGAWDYTDASQGETDGPADGDGHGTHVASTAAGNRLPTINLASGEVPVTLSGVAPRANLIAYDVCQETCFTSDVVAAVNQAIDDGVHVINESIGIGGNNFSGTKQQAYLSAIEAGIVAVRAAGNSGPGPATLGSEPPWTITTAATTHGRRFDNALTGLSGGDTALGDIQGQALVRGYGPAPIVRAADFVNGDAVQDDGQCLVEFPAGTWSNGEIVVCERGTIARVQKGANVLAGGAGGLILIDDGNGLVSDTHVLPAVHISQSDGAALESWLASGSGHQGSIADASSVVDPLQADRVADFSSRGPDGIDMIKPDLAAPGVSILAAAPPANGQDEQYQFLSGTSMASPHAAGAAALVRAVRPDWTASEVRSALMGTARVSVIQGGDNGPFDIGGGRIDVARAVQSGLLLDETFDNYSTADAGNVNSLNVASLMTSSCDEICTWRRTVRNPTGATLQFDASYLGQGMMTVTPASFTLAPGASQVLEFVLDLRLGEHFNWNHGRVLLSETSGNVPGFNLPVSAYFAPGSAAMQFRKSVDRNSVSSGGEVSFTLAVTPAEDGLHSVIDALPPGLAYVDDSGSAGVSYTAQSRIVSWNGTLAGPVAEFQVPGVSPAGYFGLAGLGVTPFAKPSNPDEGGIILSGLNFLYEGQPVSEVIWSVNGTLEAGTTSGMAAGFINAELPDAGLPNSLLAPFWADLDMSSAGNWYVATLNGGGGVTYTVFEWENVPAWGEPGTSFTFQIWIQDGTENIWFTYGPMTYDGFAFGTVGFENAAGTLGASRYFDGTGTAPVEDDEYKVIITPASTTNVSFRALATGEPGDVIVNEAFLIAPSGGQRASASVGIGNLLFSHGFEGADLD
jgi:subtilisin family serine protease